MGCGMQKGASEYYRGVPVDIQLLPKIKVEIVVAKVPVKDVVEADKILHMLMGNDVEGRRDFLFENVDFSKLNN